MKCWDCNQEKPEIGRLLRTMMYTADMCQECRDAIGYVHHCDACIKALLEKMLEVQSEAEQQCHSAIAATGV